MNFHKSRDYWRHVPKVIDLLKADDRKKIILLGLVQFSLSLLDLVALLLVGLITSLSLSALSVSGSPKYVRDIMHMAPFVGHQLRTDIFALAGIAAFLLVAKTLVSAALTRRIVGFLTIREAELSSEYIDHLFHLSPIVQQKWTAQYIAGVALSGANSAITITIGQIINGIVEILSITLLFLGVTFVNPLVTISTIIFFVATAYFSTNVLGKRIKIAGNAVYKIGIESTELIQNELLTARDIYTSHKQKDFSAKFRDQRMKSYESMRAKAFIGIIPKFIFEIGLVFGAALIAGMQVLFYDARTAITGMVVFLALTSRLVPSLLKIQNSVLEIRAATSPTINFLSEYTNVKFLHDKMNSTPAIPSLPDQFDGEIVVKNMSIAYEGNDSVALHEISTKISYGQFVAITGPSGAGKTTFVDSILGMLEPISGEVSISGISPRSALEMWPNAIRYVPQDVSILPLSIKNNVTWPLTELDGVNQEIERLLELVNLDTWVNSLPDGIETILSSGGNSISGGQKQRIGIARALFNKPKILILDESTSALDTETESAITSNILVETTGLTRIVIAHRLTTIKNADRIIYIENGKIFKEGNFTELRAHVPQFEKNLLAHGIL